MVMSLPVQMASVSRVAGGVILMTTVKITPMKKIVVSCICFLWWALLVIQQAVAELLLTLKLLRSDC